MNYLSKNEVVSETVSFDDIALPEASVSAAAIPAPEAAVHAPSVEGKGENEQVIEQQLADEMAGIEQEAHLLQTADAPSFEATKSTSQAPVDAHMEDRC